METKEIITKEIYEKRRSTIKQYMVFVDEFKINSSYFEDVELGKKFKMENGLTYEVVKIQRNDYSNIEFLFLLIDLDSV